MHVVKLKWWNSVCLPVIFSPSVQGKNKADWVSPWLGAISSCWSTYSKMIRLSSHANSHLRFGPFKVTFKNLKFSSQNESFLFSPFWKQITTHPSLITTTLRLRKHMACHQNGCASRCYWLIEMHLILNDYCPSEHFLVWCPNDRAAVTACFLMLVLWATHPHTITSSRSTTPAL